MLESINSKRSLWLEAVGNGNSSIRYSRRSILGQDYMVPYRLYQLSITT